MNAKTMDTANWQELVFVNNDLTVAQGTSLWLLKHIKALPSLLLLLWLHFSSSAHVSGLQRSLILMEKMHATQGCFAIKA